MLFEPIRSSDKAVALFASLAGGACESCAFAYLDPEWRIVGLRHSPAGEARSVQLPMRGVVADVIAFGASAVIMAHNHPGGDPRPSDEDRWATNRLARVLAVIEAPLVDHLLIAGSVVVSFRELGLL